MPCFAASAPQVTGTMVKTVDAIHDENGEVQLLHEEDTMVRAQRIQRFAAFHFWLCQCLSVFFSAYKSASGTSQCIFK